jgi:hypothetical protein
MSQSRHDYDSQSIVLGEKRRRTSIDLSEIINIVSDSPFKRRKIDQLRFMEFNDTTIEYDLDAIIEYDLDPITIEDETSLIDIPTFIENNLYWIRTNDQAETVLDSWNW